MMRNKTAKKNPTQNKPVVKKSSDSCIDRKQDKVAKRKNQSSICLQNSLDFLQQHHHNFFQQSLVYSSGGDADSYFKNSLRNYEQFDLTPYPASNKLLKSVQSLDLLKRPTKTKKAKQPATLPSSKQETPRPNNSSLKSPQSTDYALLLSPSKSLKQSEVDLDDVFYSPSSQSQTFSQSTATLKAPDDSSVSLKSEDNTLFDRDQSNQQEPSSLSAKMEEAGEEGSIGEMERAIEDALGDEALRLEDEDEDDEMKEVERIIQQATDELEQVAEENQQFFGAMDEGEEEGEDDHGKAGGDGSVFKFDPAIDAAVLRELEDAERQAKETAKIIYELKVRVTELLKKEKTTEAEARELEQKNKELKAQMLLFEEKTKRIQFLIAQTNLFENMVPPKPALQVKHTEDVLPKVIVCGVTEQNIPKLILCDDKKKKKKCCGDKEIQSVVPKFAKRLSDSYTMQERLAAENADLEGMRYKLQADLLNKDQTIEYLQRKLCGIQCEMRMICKENSALNDKIQEFCTPQKESPCLPKPSRKMPCGKGKNPCPADLEHRLNEYSETTRNLEKQLCDMESDVKTMQTELTAVQAERDHLEQHRKILICPPICMPPMPCMPGPPCAPAMPCMPPCMPSCDQQLRELKEQYLQLQDDFKSKVTEVSALRADNEKLKATAREAIDSIKACEERAKEFERQMKLMKLEKSQFMGSKEQLIEQEQQLVVAKQRFREAQDELEELRAFIQDQQGQMDDYRNKYLEAQQQVEEQKRQIDLLEMDSVRVNEQVNLELQRVKGQFQEKLQELLPLPDLLKTTQLKLQESQQMHLLAERNAEALARDLQVYKEQIQAMTDQMERVRSDQELGEGAKLSLTAKIEELEARLKELQEENDNVKIDLARAEEMADESDRMAQERLHEIAQLSAQLDSVREESARQVARNKERCETVRRSMQNQISDLERHLAQSRAQARAAQKDRDEIRQKMQSQINNLHENFEDAQMRIRNLQGHVNFLKDSCKTVPNFGDGTESVLSDGQDPCNCGNEF